MLISFAALLAPSRARAAEPGEELKIYVVTIQPGDAVFEKFGHNAIWVQDAYAPPAYADTLYHWGIFEFNGMRFFVKYARGEMDYMMAGFPGVEMADQLRYYQGQNRSIWTQELNLTPAQRIKLRDFLRWNEQPENATYRYNYYTDNCSTRVRDAIDLAVDGELKKQLEGKPSGTTFRWHTRRCTRSDLFWYSALHTVLGPATDKPIDQWQECFLPPKLRDHLNTIMVKDANGQDVPLVKDERILNQSSRPPEADAPPNWFVQFLLAGVVIAAIFVALERWARQKRAGRFFFALVTTLVTALVGIGAFISLWFWLGSDHRAAWRNESLLAWSPLALPLAFLIPVLWRNWPRARKTAVVLALVIAATTILCVLLSPIGPQNNYEPLAFIVPVNFALAWCIQHQAQLARCAFGGRQHGTKV